jgi:hypothetical protein
VRVDTDNDDEPARAKRISTLRAQLAVHGGHELIELDDGALLISKWNLSRRCDDLDQVTEFARRIGVPC